ncbi:MAG: DsbA family protein [Leptolyngbyaceae cyanobacterium SM1_3_5]|nr:DsbA family protein [Leptolyngbyaceae cyanobacterium SM1_3_5]
MSNTKDSSEDAARSNPGVKYAAAPVCPPVVPDDHIQGHRAAKVSVVEYGDYQCSRCVKAHEILKLIQTQFGSQILFVFRHFPRSDIHPFAQHAAEAAEAANSQQKFWQMHDRLFNLSEALDDASLVEHAIALKLNINQFLQEMTADVHVDRVLQDIETGIRSGVNSTPTFFINGSRFEGDWENSALLTAIQHELQR